MIRDPAEIKRLAPLKEDENWRFRSFVKLLPRRRQREINRIAATLGRQAEAEMDCRTCGACCRDNWVCVNDKEADRLARRLSLPVLQFREQFLSCDESHEEPGMDAKPCAFLSGTICSVYYDRPGVCRGYPYVGGDVATRMWGIIERAEVCPIVFEMLEGLKRQLRFSGGVVVQSDIAGGGESERRR